MLSIGFSFVPPLSIVVVFMAVVTAVFRCVSAFEVIFIFEVIWGFEVVVKFESVLEFEVVLGSEVVREFRLIAGLETAIDPEVISVVVFPRVSATNRRNRLMSDSLNIVFLLMFFSLQIKNSGFLQCPLGNLTPYCMLFKYN